MTSPDFRTLFNASPNPYMVLDQHLRFVAANRAYEEATGARLEQLLGRKVTEAFPHDPTRPDNDNARTVLASLERVLATGLPDELPAIRYRVNGRERIWSATHTPVLSAEGRVDFILQHTVDVTEVDSSSSAGPAAGVLARAEQVNQRNGELHDALRALRSVFDSTPGAIALLRGPHHVFELANRAYMQLVGGREVLGKPAGTALPELAAQGFIALLDRVYETGEPFVGKSVPATVSNDDGPHELVLDFTYQPIVGPDGKSTGIFVQINDVTAQKQLAALAEQARAEATQAQERIQLAFEQAPLGITQLRGPSYVIEVANKAVCEIWGRSKEAVLGRRLFEALPEIAGQGLEALLDGVRSSRKSFVGTEVLVRLGRGPNGAMEDVYFTFIYQPVLSASGEVDSILVVATEVTGMVLARKDAERSHAQLEAMFDSFPEPLYTGDATGLRTANSAARALLGLDPTGDVARLRSMVAALKSRHPDGRPVSADESPFMRALQGATTRLDVVITPPGPNGERVIRSSGAPILVDGKTVGAVVTHSDLTDLRRAEAEARAARIQAEQANHHKDEFLALLSHELRTPLTSMLGWLQMMKSGLLSQEKRAHALEVVERNARAQAQLIDDLLDVSRIISGKLRLETEPMDLATAAAAAVETVRHAAESKGVRLEVTLDSAALVNGDAQRLQQIVWNLLVNAVKFTPAGGLVQLRLRRDDGGVAELEVADDGCGIPADFLPYVFDRFRQAEGGTTRRNGGLGLGLSIVQHLVKAHAGEIHVQSGGEGKGATFTVRIPMVGASQRLKSAANAIDALSFPSLPGFHVLVVDDERDTREYVSALLQSCAVRVTEAANAAAAIEVLRRDPPDLLLSDIGMPGGDGYQLIERVRSLPADQGGRTPAVALTAYARTEDRTRALIAGFQNHVTKPINAPELLAVVASLARREDPSGSQNA